MTDMLAAAVNNNRVEVQTREAPQPGPKEALIRVHLAGVCGTDLEILAGYVPFTGILGHEFTGRVEAAPQNPDLVGRRVVADINCGCGQCPRCLHGDPRHCSQRKVLGIRERNGAFAQYICVPTANLHPVPDNVSDEEAVFAEPLAAALEVSQQVHMTAPTRTAVLGDGKLGLLCALALSCFAPRLTLFGRHASKLNIAHQQGVATHHLQSDQPPHPHQHSYDLVVDCTGRTEGVDLALHLVRPERTVVVKTTSHNLTSLDMSRLVVNEISLLGSRCGDLGLAVHFLAHKWVNVQPLIDAVFPLTHVHEALHWAGQRGALKVLLKCNSYETRS
ncbi:MAG: alcohol dehydrogenase catalytic domain-containing protein [Desulfovermiculus sp.]